MPTTLKRANVKVKVDGQFQDLGLLQSDVATQLTDEITERKSNDNNLEANKIPYPLNPHSKYGNPGDILRTDGEGGTKWAPIGLPTDAQTQDAINNWFNGHPEAITTVQDDSISDNKLMPSLRNKVNAIVPITLYQDLVIGEDWTAALQEAIDDNKTVLVNVDIKIYGTVNIPTKKTIKLDAITVSKPSDANNTDPIFYLGNQYGSLIGSGNGSVVRSYVDSPHGIIKIGSPTNTTATKIVTYCKVSDLYIQGKANENDNMGIHLCGTAASGYVSYFHIVSNLTIDQVAMGIVFNNAANANIVTNIEFLHCGYNLTTGAFCFIRTQGDYSIEKVPLENVITNAYHHQSTNATTIYIGTAIGLNRIDNIICEQGGTTARACYVDPNEPVLSEYNINVIKFTYNTAYSITASDEFLQRNVIETQKLLRIPSIISDSASFRNELTVAGQTIRSVGKIIYDIASGSDLPRNTDYTIGAFKKFTTTTPINRSCIVNITGVTKFTSNNSDMAKYSEQKYRIIYNANTYTIEELTSKTGTLELSINNTGELILHTPSHSGVTATKIEAKILVEMYGYCPPTPFEIVDTTNFTRIN